MHGEGEKVLEDVNFIVGDSNCIVGVLNGTFWHGSISFFQKLLYMSKLETKPSYILWLKEFIRKIVYCNVVSELSNKVERLNQDKFQPNYIPNTY